MSVYNIILKNRAFMLTNLDPNYIIEELYSNEVLREKEYQSVKSKSTDREQLIKIVNYLSSCDVEQFFEFCEVLKEDFDWVSEQLLSDAKDAGLEKVSDDLGASRRLTVETLQTEDFKSAAPSEQDLISISKNLVKTDNWEEVIFLLGLDSAELDRCKLASSGASPTLQCMKALVLWRRKKGAEATYLQLATAMQSAQVGGDCLKKLIEHAVVNKDKSSR